ncbi:hypothetical protein MJ561_13530 [Klebsiella pneumoniae]|nr:hypothetical protein MJ561_13530 [Klebsiella pneumoniae]
MIPLISASRIPSVITTSVFFATCWRTYSRWCRPVALQLFGNTIMTARAAATRLGMADESSATAPQLHADFGQLGGLLEPGSSATITTGGRAHRLENLLLFLANRQDR